jgi:hypothetical protein
MMPAAPATFGELLDTLINSAEFDDDDVAHLKRWRATHRPDELWRRIAAPFNAEEAEEFILLVLVLRRAAEKADRFNKERPELEQQIKRLAPKARRHILRGLADNKITHEQYSALKQDVEKATIRSNFFDPFLSKRSDDKGSRQRTIFCRMLSDILYDTRSRWHDEEVATLCEIAFDYGDVTIDAVRAARKGLPVRKSLR